MTEACTGLSGPPESGIGLPACGNDLPVPPTGDADVRVGWPSRVCPPWWTRVEVLRQIGVTRFAHWSTHTSRTWRSGLTEWVLEFAERTPEAYRPRPCTRSRPVTWCLAAALDAGARCVKVHVQVGSFDPRDPLLTGAWGMLAGHSRG